MDTNETEKIQDTVEVALFGCCIIFVIGIIFHILGLWLEIFVWVEKICCFVLICMALASLNPNDKFRKPNDELNKAGLFVLATTLIICIAMAFAIYKNYEQVDREREQKRHKFEQECRTKADKKYLACKAENVDDATRVYREYACASYKKAYIESCGLSAIDWRDTEIKIAFNTINLMAGTLAIGTAIIVDGILATIEYPFVLLFNGKNAKFGGNRWYQDFVIKMGLYYVSYGNIFSDREKYSNGFINFKMGNLSIGKYDIYIFNNIFVAMCIAVMCIHFICLIKNFVYFWFKK